MRSRWILIAVLAVVGTVIGAASWSISETAGGSHYRATQTLIFRRPSDNSTWAYQSLDEIALLASGGEVPKRVGNELGTDVTRRIITRSDESATTLEITVVGHRPQRTKELADAVGEQLETTVAETERARFVAERDATMGRLQSLSDELGQLDARLAAATGADRDVLTAQRRGVFNQYSFTYERFQQFTAQDNGSKRLSTFEEATPVPISSGDYDDLLGLVARGENHIRVDPNATPAEVPSDSSWSDGPVRRALIGGFVGVVLGLGLVFGAEQLKPRLRTRGDVERAFAVPVLAQIPRLDTKEQGLNGVVAATSPRSRGADAYRAARSGILRHAEADSTRAGAQSTASALPSRRGRGLVIMVTSASPGEGKTVTTANLAAVFAEAGASVLAVSCDLHRPRLGNLLGASGSPGEIVATAIDGVRCITGVTDDPTLAPPAAVALQHELVLNGREHFDVVILDTAPVVTTNDATELVSAADVVVLVARAGVTTLGAAERARALLEHLGASVPGVVLVDPHLSSKDEYYDSGAAQAHPVRDWDTPADAIRPHPTERAPTVRLNR